MAVNVENGQITKLMSEETRAIRLPQWFPNGDKIIHSSNNGGFNLFSIDRNGKNKSKIIFVDSQISGGTWDYKISPVLIK